MINMEFKPKTVKVPEEYDLFESVDRVLFKDLNKGDQIAVKAEFGQLNPALRNFELSDGEKHYFHHGIYTGNGEVIHLSGPDKWRAIPNKVDLLVFMEGACDKKLYRVRYKEGVCLPVEQTIQMAEDIVENTSCWKRGFNILYYNCETFATYLKTKIEASSQAQKALRQLNSYQEALFKVISTTTQCLGSVSFDSDAASPCCGSGKASPCCGSGKASPCCGSGKASPCCGSGKADAKKKSPANAAGDKKKIS